MPTVRELTALYETFMVSPQRGPGVCRTCLTFTDPARDTGADAAQSTGAGHAYAQCYPCANTQPWLDLVAPISYSIAGGQLHHALVSYKRLTGHVAQRLRTELAAVLWRYLDSHERCLATSLGTDGFELVTTVPSGRRDTGESHPLEQIVGELCGHTRGRYIPLLERADHADASEHEFDPQRFKAPRAIAARPVLLIDDTWTTGASAQAAAAALKRAGAGPVAVVVIGRHLKRSWRRNGARLDQLPRGFDWDTCVHCEPASLASARQWRHR
jgi:hypothetical protein